MKWTEKEWWFGRKKSQLLGQPQQKWISVGNQIVINPTDSLGYIKDGYQANDIVYAIANIIADKATVAPWRVCKVVDESSLKQYKAVQKQIINTKGNVAPLRKEAMRLKDTALVEVSDNRLNALLEYPNNSQSWSEFVREGLIYKLITGNKYIASDILDAGANTGKPGQLYHLPAQHTAIVSDGYFPASAVEYRVMMGQLIYYAAEQVLHEKYPSVDFTLLNNLYGMSPLQAASMLVTRTNEGTKSGATAFKNMGRDGMVYLDDPNIDPTTSQQAMELTKQQWYKDNYHADNKKGLGFTNAKLGFVKFGLSPVDLAIIESEKWDVVRLCSVYGVPPVLLMPDNSTYNNIEHAEKALTTRAVLPHLISLRDSLNRKLQTDWGYKGQNIVVDFDISVYNELQGDNKEMIDYLEKAWWYPPKLKYELAGIDIPDYLNESELERIYAVRGTIPLSDVGLDTIVNAADSALNKSGLNDYK